jgi:hypothetical protein
VIVEIEGEAPKFNGWAFAATLQHGEDGNILAVIPGFSEKIPTQYRMVQRGCEHCAGNRNWKDTYLLHHDDGSWKQVGRVCMKDFLGHSDPHKLAHWAELLIELGGMMSDCLDEGWGGGGGESWWPIEHFLAITAAVIRLDGWLSRGKARELAEMERRPGLATADAVLNLLTNKMLPAEFRRRYSVMDADRKMAADALVWAMTIEANPESDYLWNLRVSCQREYVNYRMAGLVASLIAAYKRAVEAEVARTNTGASKYFGEIKERSTWTLTVTKTLCLDGFYGLRTLIRFLDPEGNVAIWFATGSREQEFEAGKTYRLKATVKAHEDYKGVRQTVLKNGVLMEEAAQAAA